jgi:hypothetical protein
MDARSAYAQVNSRTRLDTGYTTVKWDGHRGGKGG